MGFIVVDVVYFDFVNQESVVYMGLRALVVLLVSQSECRTLINKTTQCSRTAMTRSLCLPSLRESRLLAKPRSRIVTACARGSC